MNLRGVGVMRVNAIPLPGEGVVLFCPSPTPLPVSKGERKDHFAFTSGLHEKNWGISRGKYPLALKRRFMIYYTPVRLKGGTSIFENRELGIKENYDSYTRSNGHQESVLAR